MTTRLYLWSGWMCRVALRLLLLTLLLVLAQTLCGQTIRVPLQRTPIRPALTLPLFFSITALTASTSVPLVQGGVGQASPSIQFETTYLLGLVSTVNVYGYFATNNALTDLNVSTNSITADAVKARCTTGSLPSYTPFTQVIPFGTGFGVKLLTFSALAGLLVDRTDTVDLQIDLSGYPQQPAGSYRGTLILQAQAF